MNARREAESIRVFYAFSHLHHWRFYTFSYPLRSEMRNQRHLSHSFLPTKRAIWMRKCVNLHRCNLPIVGRFLSENAALWYSNRIFYTFGHFITWQRNCVSRIMYRLPMQHNYVMKNAQRCKRWGQCSAYSREMNRFHAHFTNKHAWLVAFCPWTIARYLVDLNKWLKYIR